MAEINTSSIKSRDCFERRQSWLVVADQSTATSDNNSSCFRKYRSWILYTLSFVIVSLAAGIVYGWPALRQQLLDEGSNLTEKQFGLIYTIGSWSTQGGRFFAGIARDKFGTKIITCLALVSLMAGMVGVALCDPSDAVVLSICFFFIGLGSAAQLCVQPVASLFPNNTGIVLSSLSGAFQISGLVFLLLALNERQISFLIFTGILFMITIIAAFMLPKSGSFLLSEEIEDDEDDESENYEKELELENDSKNNILIIKNDDEELMSDIEKNECKEQEAEESSCCSVDYAQEKNIENQSENEGNKNEIEVFTNSTNETTTSDTINDNDEKLPTAFTQMKTAEYILLCTWFSISIIPLQFYVAIIGFLLEEMGDDDRFYTNIFAYTYAGAAITSPIPGWIADRYGLGVAQGGSTLLVGISFFILAADTSISLDVHTIGLTLYGIGRMGIFGLFFVNCGKRLGYKNFGTLAGLGLLTSAISSLLQYPLISWTVGGYGTIVNNVLGIILVAQAPYFVWMHRRERLYESAISVEKKVF